METSTGIQWILNGYESDWFSSFCHISCLSYHMAKHSKHELHSNPWFNRTTGRSKPNQLEFRFSVHPTQAKLKLG